MRPPASPLAAVRDPGRAPAEVDAAPSQDARAGSTTGEGLANLLDTGFELD